MNDRPSVRILLVEDDENDVLFLKRAFRKASSTIDVEVVRDGEEAVRRLSRSPAPDRVILDLKLPRMNGTEVLSWIRSRPDLEHLSVTILTSSGEPSDLGRIRALGVDEYIVKPIAQEGLVEIVGGLCARWGAVPAARRQTG